GYDGKAPSRSGSRCRDPKVDRGRQQSGARGAATRGCCPSASPASRRAGASLSSPPRTLRRAHVRSRGPFSITPRFYAGGVSVIRVFLAGDHETVRHGLRLLIDSQADMQVVGEAGTGRLAVQQAQVLHPTVVVLDIAMPDWNGLDAAREMAVVTPEVAIVALSRYNEEAYVQALLGAGVSAYVLKQ